MYLYFGQNKHGSRQKTHQTGFGFYYCACCSFGGGATQSRISWPAKLFIDFQNYLPNHWYTGVDMIGMQSLKVENNDTYLVALENFFQSFQV